MPQKILLRFCRAGNVNVAARRRKQLLQSLDPPWLGLVPYGETTGARLFVALGSPGLALTLRRREV